MVKIEKTYPCVTVSAPDLRRNKAFTAWLNQGARGEIGGPLCATWHRPGADGKDAPISEGSDLFVWMDRSGEGSDSDMPARVWNRLRKLVGDDFAGIIWIKFL